MPTFTPLSPSLTVHFVTLALMFWCHYFFQAVDAAAKPASPGKEAGKEVKNETQKTKRPPASTSASLENRQVQHLGLQEASLSLLCPTVCSFGPIPSTARLSFNYSVTLLGGRGAAEGDPAPACMGLTF